MKTLRKIIPLMLLSASVFSTSGCSVYHSKAASKEDFVGFYVLETYKSKHNKDDEDTYDRKADEGIVACFTLDINGYGYYGYKSKTVDAWVKPVYSRYVTDDKDPSLYKSINMSANVKKVYCWDWKVGCLEEPPMGFNWSDRVVKNRPWPFKDVKETTYTLSYTVPWVTYTGYNPDKEQIYQDVCYKKVSDSTDYKQINQLLGTNFVPGKPMEMGGTSGFYIYSYSLKDSARESFVQPYEYAIIDSDSYANGKMTMYYSETSNPGKKSTQVSVSITNPGSGYKVNAFGRNFYGYISNAYETPWVTYLNTDSSEYSEQDPYLSESFSPYYGEGTTLDEVIDKAREPQNVPYVLHNIVTGQKKYDLINQDYYTSEYYIEGLHLDANEEFAINLNYGNWAYFEDYLEEGTAGGKVVVGSKAGARWTLEYEEQEVHYLKATQSGSYNIRVDTTGKVHIVHL